MKTIKSVGISLKIQDSLKERGTEREMLTTENGVVLFFVIIFLRCKKCIQFCSKICSFVSAWLIIDRMKKEKKKRIKKKERKKEKKERKER